MTERKECIIQMGQLVSTEKETKNASLPHTTGKKTIPDPLNVKLSRAYLYLKYYTLLWMNYAWSIDKSQKHNAQLKKKSKWH